MDMVTAAGVLGDFKLISGDVKDILVNVLPPIGGAAFVLWTWGNTKSPLKTLLACVFAGAIWWGITNMSILRDKTGEDLNRDARTAVVVVVQPAAGGESP
ncbi:hypothetical protein ACIA8E_36205 [Streptomyces sp. NPDC051664]|uniref:hypothetical protein n=1 Tax=Streptomyces sp. NPDC051664 TaxID=3365668 RepID=UPI0037A234C7